MVHHNRPFLLRALTLWALAAALFLSGSGCQNSDAGSSREASRSLYDRLGGEPKITLVVDGFFGKAAADPLVNLTRAGHLTQWEATPENIAKFKKHFVQFIDSAAGGPQKYEGSDLAAVHKGMSITDDEWNAAVADLKAALYDLKVPDKEQIDLVGIVEGTRGQIVGK